MTARPAVGPARPFTVPRRGRIETANGMRASLVEVGVVPKVTLRLVIAAGSIYEPAGKPWVARLLAELLREGAGQLDAEGLARAFAAIGGELSIGVDDEYLTVRTRVLSEHGPEAVRLLALVAREAQLPESELPRLKADLLRRLDLARAEPAVLAASAFRAAIYGSHPLGRGLPADEQVEALTIGDVRDFMAATSGPARSHLYVAGRFDVPPMENAIMSAYAGWEGAGGAPIETARPTSGRAIHLVDRPGAEQSTIYMGLPVPHPGEEDYVPLVVANALLGGSFASRITQNIREEKGYTYSPRSAVSTHDGCAIWTEVADVTTDVTGDSLREIFAEIERLGSEQPGEAEVTGIQRYVAGTYTLRYATHSGIIDQLEFLDLHGLDESFAESYVSRVNATGPAEVQRIAAAHLPAGAMTMAIAGDLAVIREQVEPYGPIVE